MSDHIEWVCASEAGVSYLLAGEEAPDHQEIEDPNHVGVVIDGGGGGACVYGTPDEIREVADRLRQGADAAERNRP